MSSPGPNTLMAPTSTTNQSGLDNIPQAPGRFPLRGFKQPTVSFFPLNASGQFDLGYDPGLNNGGSEPQLLQRQASSRSYAQPQQSAPPPPSSHFPADVQSRPNDPFYPYSTTTTYDPRTGATHYTIYPTNPIHDDYVFDPSSVPSKFDVNSTPDYSTTNPDYDTFSDIASSTSSSQLSSFSVESATTKSSVYDENPELRGRTGSIPTFVNVSAAAGQTQRDDPYASSPKDSYPPPSSQRYSRKSTYPQDSDVDSTVVQPMSPRPVLPQQKQRAYSRERDLRHFSLSSLSTALPSYGAPSGNGATPATPRPGGGRYGRANSDDSPLTLDTGSPWGRYTQDDVEAAYDRPSIHSIYASGETCMSQPDLASGVVFDEPEQQSSFLRRVSSVADKPGSRRLRKVSTSAVRGSASGSRPMSTVMPGNGPIPGEPGFVFPGTTKRSSVPLPQADQSKPPPMSRLEALRSRRTSNPSLPPPLAAQAPLSGSTHVIQPGMSQPNDPYLPPSRKSSSRSSRDEYDQPREPRTRRVSRSRSSTVPDFATAPPMGPTPVTLSAMPQSQPPPRLGIPHRGFSESEVPRRPPSGGPIFQPIRRHSDGEVPATENELQRARSVRWNENLICPSPILPHQRRKGWYNRRGDQLWTNDGAYRPPRAEDEYPVDLDGYPECGQGWMNEEGVCIDVHHRLIPKPPLRSALKRRN